MAKTINGIFGEKQMNLTILKTELNYQITKLREKFCLHLANFLPKRIQLWCFILVYGSDGNGPCEVYRDKYDFYKTKHNISGM